MFHFEVFAFLVPSLIAAAAEAEPAAADAAGPSLMA